MGLFDRLFKKKEKENEFEKFIAEYSNTSEPLVNANTTATESHVTPPEESYTFPEGTIMQFEDEVLDVESPENIAKLKHNLKILMAQAKQKGKVDKFYLIREDDFFPTDWEWTVASDQTNLESVVTSLSMEVRCAYAKEQAGIESREIMGMLIPNLITDEEEKEALSKIDKNIGALLLPSHFRSTKHFTVNTPLSATGDYNWVKTGRNFTIIDSIDNFLDSGYAYSVAGHDAYLDVTHEPLKISDQGFVLIADEKYEDIIKDPTIAEELSKRKVIRFKGDESMAINMLLTANGALPTRIGFGLDYSYDKELNEIYENSFKTLAIENGIAYDQSHAGELRPNGGGHFSNYYDDKNMDYNKAIDQVVEFLKKKFPEQADSFSIFSIIKQEHAQNIVRKIGAKNLLEAINEYNEIARNDMGKKVETYREERQSITSEEHDKFVSTVHAIDAFYKTPEASSRYDVESVIKKFFQGKSKQEQLEAADSVLTMLDVTAAVLPNVDRQVLREARTVEAQEHAKEQKVSLEYGE